MLRKIFSVLAISVAFVGTANAERSFADIYAECGLGAMFFPEADQNSRTLAIITNITWDAGTTAISSEFTTPDSCKGGAVTTAKFINETAGELEMDLAMGKGDYLDATMSLMGCSANANAADVMRDEFANVANSVYWTGTQFDRAEALFNISQKVSVSCQI